MRPPGRPHVAGPRLDVVQPPRFSLSVSHGTSCACNRRFCKWHKFVLFTISGYLSVVIGPRPGLWRLPHNPLLNFAPTLPNPRKHYTLFLCRFELKCAQDGCFAQRLQSRWSFGPGRLCQVEPVGLQYARAGWPSAAACRLAAVAAYTAHYFRVVVNRHVLKTIVLHKGFKAG
jgi:hypothetical protein